jgi:hypothetical protein
MKLFNNLALMTALGFSVVGTAGASSINFFASGSFNSCTGCVINTVAPAFGDTYTNNNVQFMTGSSVININYADLATATTLSNLNSPSLASYGIFRVDDAGATAPVTIGAFSFSLVIHDMTDAGTTTFVGSSAGGTISHNSSDVTVSWSPVTGAIGPVFWSIFTPTPLVPPTTTNGETSIQGAVTSAIPEPASMLLMGAGLLGLGFVSRRKLAK